jgi:hypothetical protein
LIDFLDLLLKHGENGTWRVAGLELSGERMEKNILLCTLFISFQGIIDYRMEVGGRGGGAVSAGHKIGREEFVGEEEYDTAHCTAPPSNSTNTLKTCLPLFGPATKAVLTFRTAIILAYDS